MDMGVLITITQVTVFALMMSIGLEQTPRSLTKLLRNPALLLRSLLATIVLFPAVVALLLWLFDLPMATATGLAVLAASPAAPMMTKRARMAGAATDYVSSLQLTLALLAVVVTPVTLAIYYALFDLGTAGVTPWAVARQIAVVTFLPVVLGLLLRAFFPGATARVRKPVALLANGLFLVLVALLVVALATRPELRQMLDIGIPSIAAVALAVLAGLTFGHLLGGPARAQRAGLATASVARNVGLALYIMELDTSGQRSIPTVLVYLLVGAGLAVPYGLWVKQGKAVTT